MREYGWICLCYTIKHFVYIIDTVMLMGKKYCTPIDILPPVVNFIMWGLWMLYGFLNVGLEIMAGPRLRAGKDLCNEDKDNYDKCIEPYEKAYSDTAKWTWLWIVPAIACVVNLALWLLGGI